jgi:hypothetical protein
MEVVSFALGVLILALTFWDLFQAVVVPRPAPGRFGIARYVIRPSWRIWRAIGRGSGRGARHDTFLGLFAPAAAISLLAVWLLAMILGYGLVLFGLRGELRPVPPDLGSTLYFAASSLLTLGFGGVVAVEPAARVVVVAAAASGLGAVALVITFLFSLYGSYQRREIQVVALQAVAGAPPSAVALLETYAQLDLVARLPELFVNWELWAAEVLDSHVAYPLLGFFRSSHDNLSWISALGTVLDAASLVLTTIKGVPRGEAELARRVGAHLVEDISNLGFQRGRSADLDRAAFDAVYARLSEVGYQLEKPNRAWPAFEAARATYASRLEAMATYWATPAASWLAAGQPLNSPAHPDEPAVGATGDR